MASNLRLWINAETGSLLSSGTSFVAASPAVLNVGDTIPLELHLVAGAGVAATPYEVPFPAGATIKVAVGSIGAAPTSGQWRLSVSSTETADLPYNASASAIQTALNALSAVSTAGGVTVAALGGGYSITWNTVGTKPAILAGSDTLAPASYEAIVILQAGDVSTREIVYVALRQNPIALTSTFAPIGSPGVSVSTVSAWNGSNKIIRVQLSNSPKGGQWTLGLGSNNYAFRSSAAPSDIRQSLGALCSDVSLSGNQSWDITLTSNLTATVNGSALVASDAIVGELSLSTSEAIAFLGTATSATATLEISSEAAGIQTTLAQAICSVDNTVVSPGAIEPVTAGVVLTESVANNRFVRRDVGQSPTASDLDIIWPNLGVTADGSDVAAALSGASSPSSGNVFLTASGAAASFAPVGWNPFDQELNIDDTVNFANVTIGTVGSPKVYSTTDGLGITVGGAKVFVSDPVAGKLTTYAGTGITFQDTTFQNTAFIPADYLAKADNLSGLASTSTARTNLGLGTMAVETATDYLKVTDAASTYLTITTAASTYALQSDFDQGVKTTDSPTFSNITLSAFLGGAKITFEDSTTQDTRVVREVQTNGSGIGTSFTTHYPDEVKVIDDTGTAYWVPARLA